MAPLNPPYSVQPDSYSPSPMVSSFHFAVSHVVFCIGACISQQFSSVTALCDEANYRSLREHFDFLRSIMHRKQVWAWASIIVPHSLLDRLPVEQMPSTERVEQFAWGFTVCPFASCLVKSNKKCVLCADAKWLQTEFFKRYATELAHPGIQLTVPADTLFLTPLMLDKVNWASQRSCGPAWQQAVTAALTPEDEPGYSLCSSQAPLPPDFGRC
jgi:hypothetical protein